MSSSKARSRGKAARPSEVARSPAREDDVEYDHPAGRGGPGSPGSWEQNMRGGTNEFDRGDEEDVSILL